MLVKPIKRLCGEAVAVKDMACPDSLHASQPISTDRAIYTSSALFDMFQLRDTVASVSSHVKETYL